MPTRAVWGIGRQDRRRWLGLLGVILLVAPALWGLLGPLPPRAASARPLAVGFTFSQRQTTYLTLPWDEAFTAALDLSPSMVRLGAYWDEIEAVEGVDDWTTLDAQLDEASARGLDVILTVGMKAPRWPEYFLPPWLEERIVAEDGATVSEIPEVRRRALEFIDRVVRRYREDATVVAWQVENEPLDPAGPRSWRIGADFLAEEVALTRWLDDRPVIVTMFVEVNPSLLLPGSQDELNDRATTILGLADILGLDLYPNRAFRAHGGDWYFRWPAWVWQPTVEGLQRLASQHGRRSWIMEAQAEPWEPGQLVYTDAPLSRSVQPDVAATAVTQLHNLGFDTILLWGVEHWYMRRVRHDDSAWWDQMLTFFPLATADPSPLVSLGAQGAPGS